MGYIPTPIANCVTKVSKWNPRQEADAKAFPYVDLSSVNKETKSISLEDVPIVAPAEAPSRARQLIAAGDVLVSTVRPNLNGVALVCDQFDGATASTGYCVLRPNPNKLDSKYLFYWVQMPNFVELMMKQATGASYPAVSDRVVKGSEIPLPPLTEQQRIAVILDKADALRRKRQRAIDLADQFLRSVFLEMFGDPVTNPKEWEERTLSDIALVRSGVTKGRKLEGKKTVSVPYMRVANVQDGHIKLDDVQEIEVLETDVERYALNPGDLLLTEGGDPDKLGRGAVWHGEVMPCIHQNHIFCVRADAETVHPEFLSAQIGSQRGKRYFLKVGKQTTGIATINKTVLSAYPAIVPPMDQQLKYVALVEKVRSSLSRVSASDTEIKSLFHSMSQQAFSGKL
ncbi:restriction endonuclease subunit S [Pontibacterium granulatum]|uniref:restriction endonuclease subunit S n=1 Tax=Pontibacterium granulatum TaxID=2036029 RepID=UPI00249CCD85|nr:restriction endonuclease subunit S [Pontibacterium granulatum]MDI3323393.1 restriction endonuclease subunit S [Pontibacterium granulatum]